MRVLFAAVLIVLGIAGLKPASAADIETERSANYSTQNVGLGRRTAPLVVYDYHPGVVVRAYWLAPWRHRHYYPTTGEKPEIGRDEDLSTTSSALEPAETFQRSWSTTSAFPPEQARGRVPPLDAEPAPGMAPPPQIPGPLK
jgi:hypothetical protein